MSLYGAGQGTVFCASTTTMQRMRTAASFNRGVLFYFLFGFCTLAEVTFIDMETNIINK